jgi:hypothetical protein
MIWIIGALIVGFFIGLLVGCPFKSNPPMD